MREVSHRSLYVSCGITSSLHSWPHSSFLYHKVPRRPLKEATVIPNNLSFSQMSSSPAFSCSSATTKGSSISTHTLFLKPLFSYPQFSCVHPLVSPTLPLPYFIFLYSLYSYAYVTGEAVLLCRWVKYSHHCKTQNKGSFFTCILCLTLVGRESALLHHPDMKLIKVSQSSFKNLEMKPLW